MTKFDAICFLKFSKKTSGKSIRMEDITISYLTEYDDITFHTRMILLSYEFGGQILLICFASLLQEVPAF